MGQRPHAPRRNDNGFTLTELLIVIVILGVLTGIVVFAVGGFTNRGEVSACKTAMKTTETAIEAFHAQNPGVAVTDIVAQLVPTYLRTDPTTTTYVISLNGEQVVGTLTGPPVAAAVPPAPAGTTTTNNCLWAKG